MSACAGTAKPSASVISRSFLITSFIPPKILRLGNGKLAAGAKNLRFLIGLVKNGANSPSSNDDGLRFEVSC